MGRVLANGPVDWGSISGRVIPKTFKKWYLIPPCLTLDIIRYVSQVKWSNPGKGATPSPTPRCSSYWKRSFLVALDYSHQLYLHRSVGEDATPFPGLLCFTLDPYFIMLSVKQGFIKYHFLSLWYDLICDWTPVSWTIGERTLCSLGQWLVLMALFCAAIRRNSVSLLKLPYFSHVEIFWCEISLVCCLKYPYSCFFFPFLFSTYCCSFDPWVVCVIYGHCNQSSSILFNGGFWVIISMYQHYLQCWQVLVLLFLTHIVC